MIRRVLTYALPALVVVLFSVVLILFVARQDTACSQVESLRTVMRTILTEGKTVALTSPDVTARQRVVAVKFYDDALLLLSPHSC